ncbi:MAG: ribosome biogenesis GTPase Der [Phycisphaerae bacterium]|nr:ribosome biogenesis GTPase Der [Phycisphaerae bacterium]
MPRQEIHLPGAVAATLPESGQVPSVVIVGRPNVGKSSLLNCLARERIAIVDPTAGVTRDRLCTVVEHQGRLFEVWDTGGIGIVDDLAAEVRTQIEVALARADLVLFVVDVQEGLLPLDRDTARRLRQIGRDVLVVANKVDDASHEPAIAEFHALGYGAPLPICALQGYGRADLLDEVTRRLPEKHALPAEPVLRLAILGRQNVGKSTLINTLADEERMIVSEVPGTTRDAVDVRFEREGRTFVAVDTAGLKRKSRVADSIEFYSLARAHRAIRRCDVALHMTDVTADLSRVDKQLAAAVERECKPCVIAVNKWDLADKAITTDAYIKYLNAHLAGLAFAPVSFISARDGRNVDATLQLIQTLFDQSRGQVQTAELNEVLQRATEAHAPPARHGKRPKLFYATQIGIGPPTFLLFASHPRLISGQYTRYLANYFRAHLPFPEVPLRIVYRARKRSEQKQERPR